ncbi:MAG: hypothetical protein NT004_08770 [Bacteroidetes bacterium]|nr:hypothetical protein [Bacteroidota bacterium]
MTGKTLINRTLITLSKLLPEKVKEVSDFADYILKKYDEEVLQRGIEKLIDKSKTFNYLKDEEDFYLEHTT